MTEKTRRGFLGFAAVGAALGVPMKPGDVLLRDETTGSMEVIRGGRKLWFVDVARVNMDDLVTPRPIGAELIIRCKGNPHECVMVHRV